MISRLHFYDLRVIGHYLGMLVLVMSFSMVIPLVIALILNEPDAAAIFLKCIGITLVCGSCLSFCRIKRGPMDWRQALLVTSLSWIVLSFFGTMPLWMSGHYASLMDAFFEGVSGLTASGFTMVIDIDHMAYSMITWRLLLHLMGGIGVLVIALALGLFGAGSSAATLYSAEGRDDHVMPEIKQTSRFIAKVSGVVIAAGSVACVVPMLIAGQEPMRAVFNAIWTTISAYATGGMQGSSMGVMLYHSWALEIITMLIMFFGVINFLLYGDLWRGIVKPFFKDIEIRTLVTWITVLVVLVTFASIMGGSTLSSLPALIRRTLYMVISAATNTGFATTYPGQILHCMGSGAAFVIVFAMIVGGSSSSTTGGIKAIRIGLVAKSIAHVVREAMSPDSVHARTYYYHRGRRVLSSDVASSAITIFLLYIISFAVGTIVGITYGYDALPAIFDSVSASANAGLSLGVVSAGMPKVLEAVYIIQMLLGRLEFIALFAAIVQIAVSLIPDKIRYRTGRRK